MNEDDEAEAANAGSKAAKKEPKDTAYAEDLRALQRRWTHPDDPGGSASRGRRVARHRPKKQPPEDGDVASDAYRVRIYDPADLRRAIREIVGADDGFDYLGPEDEQPRDMEATLSNEESLRLKRLRALRDDPRGPWRSLIRARPDMLDRLAGVSTQAPHFAAFIDLVARAVHVAIATGTPLRLPPILLLGEPGIGKTWILKRVAEAIGATTRTLAMNTTDSFRIRGLNSAWKGARLGKVAECLLAADTASPVILLDELEKTPGLDRLDQPFDVWHSLFEPENAAAFTDDYLEVPLRCDRILWIASANSIEPLPDSIVDRLLILRIPPPSPADVLVIIDGIYQTTRERLGGHFAGELTPDVRDALARLTPRRAGRVIELAIGYMAADRRKALSTDDIGRAARLAKAAEDRPSFGFLPEQR